MTVIEPNATKFFHKSHSLAYSICAILCKIYVPLIGQIVLLAFKQSVKSLNSLMLIMLDEYRNMLTHLIQERKLTTEEISTRNPPKAIIKTKVIAANRFAIPNTSTLAESKKQNAAPHVVVVKMAK